MTTGLRERRAGSSPARAALAALVLVAALAGCGKSDEPAVETPSAALTKPAAKSSPDADLVAAVPTGTDPAVASLRFELQERPALGSTFHVRVVVVPLQDADKLQLSFDVSPGLELTDASPFFHLAKVAAGEAKDHVLGIKATSEGVFEVRATVVAEGSSSAATSTFSIPVLVMPAPTTPAAPAPAPRK